MSCDPGNVIETLKNTANSIGLNFELKDRMVSVGYGQKKMPVYEMTHHELVTLNDNNVPTTTSLKVAEYFGKRHDNVLRDIKILIDGGVLGFEQTP